MKNAVGEKKEEGDNTFVKITGNKHVEELERKLENFIWQRLFVVLVHSKYVSQLVLANPLKDLKIKKYKASFIDIYIEA